MGKKDIQGNVLSTVYYTYNGAGNRITKRVRKTNANKDTYYIRDASGNVREVDAGKQAYAATSAGCNK